MRDHIRRLKPVPCLPIVLRARQLKDQPACRCATGSLTAALAWYRANHHVAALAATKMRRGAPHARMAVLGVYPACDGALTEAQMVASAAFVDGGWQYVRLEGCGHWPQREAPDKLNAVLLAWMAATGRGSVHANDGGSLKSTFAAAGALARL